MDPSSRQSPITRGDFVAAFLADHARGLLPPPLAVVAEAHAELSIEAARFLAALDGLAGAALEAAPADRIADRDGRLARILARPRGERVGAVPAGPVVGRSPMPRVVDRLAGGAGEPWRSVWFGIRRRRLGRWGDLTAELLEIGGGRVVPDHRHTGLEATLVIEGGFSDEGGTYRVGDLLLVGAEDRHRPVADPEGCLCLAVFEGGGIRPTGGVGRLIAAVRARLARADGIEHAQPQ